MTTVADKIDLLESLLPKVPQYRRNFANDLINGQWGYRSRVAKGQAHRFSAKQVTSVEGLIHLAQNPVAETPLSTVEVGSMTGLLDMIANAGTTLKHPKISLHIKRGEDQAVATQGQRSFSYNPHKGDTVNFVLVNGQKVHAYESFDVNNNPVVILDEAVEAGDDVVVSVYSSVVLKKAGPKSKYSGSVLVTDARPFGSNTWYGSISPDGTWTQPRNTPVELSLVETLLTDMSADPADTAAKYGRLTGNCCFCRKGLKDERSTDVGYGPVCADHYGLPWG